MVSIHQPSWFCTHLCFSLRMRGHYLNIHISYDVLFIYLFFIFCIFCQNLMNVLQIICILCYFADMFLTLDKDMNGTLSKQELKDYADGTLTEIFIERG